MEDLEQFLKEKEIILEEPEGREEEEGRNQIPVTDL